MNVHEWHRNGLTPAFATIEQWIYDQLGHAGAEDEACYALTLRPESDRLGLAVRVLIASDRGLFDMEWQRPPAVADRRLTSCLYRWADVRGLRLGAETRLDPETLKHGEPAWRLAIDVPELDIHEAAEPVALLAFWQACADELDKAGAR